jgi:pyruvate dehydrogenase E2 component (dihydrolipoamide acetyltransferase)
MTIFKLPDLGEGLTEAEIVHWHVSVGDRIAADQPLVAVETEKAVVEIPAPTPGLVTALFGKPGDMIKVGAPLAEIDLQTSAQQAPMVGNLAEPSRSTKAETPSQQPHAPPPHGPSHIMAAPAVRELAHELGVDLSAVSGTGPAHAITRADIERAAKSAPVIPPSRALAGEWEPLRGVRRAMARKMTEAHRSVAPATVTEEADVSSWPLDAEVTLLAVEALIAAIGAEPALNAWFDEKKEARRLNSQVDIGIAVDTPAGLIVPVLRTSGLQSREALKRELHKLIDGARARSLTRAQMADATITLSNFGHLGGLFATLVVVPPQVAILGIGRVRDVPGPAGGTLRRLLPLSLTFDHRAVTGGEAARFLTRVKTELEQRRQGE